MMRNRFLMRLAVIALVGLFAAFAWRSLPDAPSQPGPAGHDAHAADPAFRAEGVVVALDRSAGTLTISHGPLQNLGMPPMTMAFAVTDRTVLDALRPGARIRFHADAVGDGFVATQIERLPQ